MSRFFKNFQEAQGEIRRDLAEMGIPVHPHSMQDKVIARDTNYSTLELQNYTYTILGAAEDLPNIPATQPWADAEFLERIGPPVNPGEAWKLRSDVWEEFLHDGQFGYTYSDRMYHGLRRVLLEAEQNPDSRQLYIPIFRPIDTEFLGGKRRIPCSLGYLLQIRENRVNLTYFMRSCDIATHFANDVYLAVKLMEYCANELGLQPGDFTHFINSLHVYHKDVKGVF